jgi:Phage integrase, N-terminal SAM-like domain
VEQLAVDHLRPLNIGSITPESSMTVSDFAEKYFLPTVKAKKKPSAPKFYTDIVNNHLEPLLGNLQSREVTTRDVQRLLDARSSLSQTSVLRLKTGCGALPRYQAQLSERSKPGTRSASRREADRF